MLRRLDDAAGRRLLAQTAELSARLEPWQVQERLRREADADLCRGAVALHTARQAAHEKFGDLAGELYLDTAAVQMASGAPVASHRAARLASGGTVADITCGAGGDSLALAAGARVAASDLDPARAWMTRRNAEIAGLDHRVVVTRADARAPAARADALFADPARRTEAGRRVLRAADYRPELAELVALRPRAPSLAIKVGPALDEAQLPPEADEVEYVSWRGQCREAVLWFGAAASARRRATLIGGPSLVWDGDAPPPAEVGPPGEYLFDPDPAVVRSHLVGLLAHQLDAVLVAEQVAYLSAAAPATTPLARCFRILRQVPFHRRRLRQILAAEGWRAVEILRRRFPVEPADLRRDLRGAKATAQPVSLVCTRVAERPVIFICEADPQ